MASTVALELLALLRRAALPPVSQMLMDGVWTTSIALLVMTAVRLAYGRFNWWLCVPVAAALGLLALCVMPDGAKDPVGLFIWQLLLGASIAQCLLHGLWSLSAGMLRKKE